MKIGNLISTNIKQTFYNFQVSTIYLIFNLLKKSVKEGRVIERGKQIQFSIFFFFVYVNRIFDETRSSANEEKKSVKCEEKYQTQLIFY